MASDVRYHRVLDSLADHLDLAARVVGLRPTACHDADVARDVTDVDKDLPDAWSGLLRAWRRETRLRMLRSDRRMVGTQHAARQWHRKTCDGCALQKDLRYLHPGGLVRHVYDPLREGK